MKLIDKIMSVFNKTIHLRLGAVQQSNELIDYIYTVHSQAYQRLTGKAPSQFRLTMTKNKDMDTPIRSSSFVRRLTRE